jgi:DNA-binding NarL/FixJ family response regulator
MHVLLVDDHRLLADVLAIRLAELHDVTVDVAQDIPGAMMVIRGRRPDVILLDYHLGDQDGRALMREAAEMGALPPVLMLSAGARPDEVVDALAAGAGGWIEKGSDTVELVRALKAVQQGRAVLPATLLAPVLSELLRQARRVVTPVDFLDELSPRQLDVLRALMAGMDRREIAEKLVISPNTVRTHVQTLLKVAEVHSTLELVALVRRVGGHEWSE